jgi:hypothetical protein
MGGMRDAYILVGKSEGKTKRARPRCRRKDIFGMNLREMGSEVVDWTHPAHDRDRWWDIVNTVMSLRVLYKSGNL